MLVHLLIDREWFDTNGLHFSIHRVNVHNTMINHFRNELTQNWERKSIGAGEQRKER